MLSEGAVSIPAATISDPGKASFPGFLTLAFWRLYKTQVLLWQLLKSVMFWKKQLGNLCVCILGGHMENRKHCIKYNILKTFVCNQPYLGLPRKVRSPAGGAVGGCGRGCAHCTRCLPGLRPPGQRQAGYLFLSLLISVWRDRKLSRCTPPSPMHFQSSWGESLPFSQHVVF